MPDAFIHLHNHTEYSMPVRSRVHRGFEVRRVACGSAYSGGAPRGRAASARATPTRFAAIARPVLCAHS